VTARRAKAWPLGGRTETKKRKGASLAKYSSTRGGQIWKMNPEKKHSGLECSPRRKKRMLPLEAAIFVPFVYGSHSQQMLRRRFD